jgi:HEAT repeat protein
MTRSSIIVTGVVIGFVLGLAMPRWCEAQCWDGRRVPGQMVPTGRVPVDPEEQTPPPTGPRQPNEEAPPATIPSPKAGGGAAPPSSPGRAGGIAGSFATARDAGGPHRIARKGDRSDPASSWQYWWAYNRDPFLRLRERLGRNRLITGSSNWLLGSRDRDHATDIVRPTSRFLTEHVAPVLSRSIESEDPWIRAYSYLSLGRMSMDSQIPVLVEALRDPVLAVKESATIGLGLSRRPDAALELAHLLENGSEAGRLTGMSEVPVRVRAFAAIGLGFIGGETAESALIAALEKPSAAPDVSLCAMVGLGMMRCEAAAPRLRRILADRRVDDRVRSFAANALGRIGDREAIPCLVRVLREKGWQTSRSAVLALGQIAQPEDRAAIAALETVLDGGFDPQSRYWTCIALGEIGGARARGILLRHLENGNPEIRCHSALGLAVLSAGAAEEKPTRTLLARMQRERDPLVRSAFAVALGILGDAEAVPFLRRLLDEGASPSQSFYAVLALGMLDDRDSVGRFKGWLDDESVHPDIRHASALAVGLMGDRSVLRTLESSMLRSGSSIVRDGATVALGFLGDCTSIDALRRILEDERTPDAARTRAALAIGLAAEDTALPLFHQVTNGLNYRNPVDSVAALLRQF